MGEDAYASVLADHHHLIRSSLAAHGGREVGTQGDGFFAVFSSARACVAAAIEMQQALGAHEWPKGEPVRVRMGLHCGEASETTAAGLVGVDVHRAARVAAAAHGGQVVLSATATALVRDSLPIGVALRDLGPHRLKDLGRPEQLFQLQAEGLEADFPPLRSLDNPELPNNLPGYLSAFIGREAELAEVRSLVESWRLVTLTGAGGSGKTRLALQVAVELLDGSGDGVWFVDLAAIAESEQVPGAVAAALGIRDEAGRSLLEKLLDTLQHQDVLIVLDNCEHVVDACAKLADLVIRGCPRVRLVVTSREPLGIEGERVYRMPPLSLPPEASGSVEDLTGSDAVELFVERARAHDSTFFLEDSAAPRVASICRRLDGIPFAIELAAARLSGMSLEHLNERLDQRFRLLTGGSRNALARQRTLQATVDWSFGLLNEREKGVLRRLSVFVGGFDLEAAEAVCIGSTIDVLEVADILASLVNKSLVTGERSSETLRYRLLETIRQYASDHLVEAGDPDEIRSVRNAHAEYYLRLAEKAAPELTGPRQGWWLKRLDLEWDNIRATLAHLEAEPGRTEEILRLGVALHRFLGTRWHLDAIVHLRAALERPEPLPAALRARAFHVTGSLVTQQGLDDRLRLSVSSDFAERALELARELHDPVLVIEATSQLGFVAYLQGEPTRAATLGEQSLELAADIGDHRLIGEALLLLGTAASTPERERELHLEALGHLRQAGDALLVCNDLSMLANSEARAGLEAALGHYEEAITAAEEVGHDFAFNSGLWTTYAEVLAHHGRFEEATPICRNALIASRRRGRRTRECAFEIFVLACCATGTGDYGRAAQLTGAHDVIDAGIVAAVPEGAYFWSPAEQRMRDDNRVLLRQLLGEVEFEKAYALGAHLSLEEAIDLALGKVRPR